MQPASVKPGLAVHCVASIRLSRHGGTPISSVYKKRPSALITEEDNETMRLSSYHHPNHPSSIIRIPAQGYPSSKLSSVGGQHLWGSLRSLCGLVPRYHPYWFFLSSITPLPVKQHTLLDSVLLMHFLDLLPLCCLQVPYPLEATPSSFYLSQGQPWWRSHKTVNTKVNKSKILYISVLVV